MVTAPAAIVRHAPAPCTEVRVSRGRSWAGLGHSGFRIVFANVSGRTCALRGWPSVVAVRRNATRVRAVRTRDTNFGPQPAPVVTVTLRPGERAFADLNAADVPLRGNDCGHYRTVRITPPGLRTAVLSAWVPYLGAFLPDCDVPEIGPIVAS